MGFYTSLLQKNLDGTAHFIKRLINHQGNVAIEKLYIVDFKEHTPFVRKGELRDKKSNYSVVTGGEVVNSFSPLYEVGYFFSCLFLAGIGTAILKKDLAKKYHAADPDVLIHIIKTELSLLSEEEIFEGIKKPVIGIVSGMDTDVVPLRYYKHHLWRLDPSVLTKRVAEIKSGEYGQQPPSPRDPDYWTEQDEKIAELAMRSTSSLRHAKIVQYYLVLQIFFKELGVDIRDVPIFFNFVPKEEIIANGPESSFLKVLIALHTPEARIKYRKITGIEHPWIITKACTQCGQGDKRVLSSKLMGDGVTVKVHCKPHEFSFRNEHGDECIIKGCGNKFSFTVPTDPTDLYKFFKNEDFSIHFAARELISLLKDSVVTPLGWVAADVGVTHYNKGKLLINVDQSKGYGDHLDMLTSAITLQHFFIQERIDKKLASQLKKRNLLMPDTVILFAYDSPTRLIDQEVTTVNHIGKVIHVSDTSALKVLEKGQSAKAMFRDAICIHAFSVEELLRLKGKSLKTNEEKKNVINYPLEEVFAS